MKSILCLVFAVYAIDAIFGVSVVINNHKVYVDEKEVDLSKLEKIEDTDYATRYLLHAGDTNITITKSKIGNAISVSSSSHMTPEELAKAKEFSKKLTQKIEQNVKNIQKQVEDQIKNIQKSIQEKLQNSFSFFPFF